MLKVGTQEVEPYDKDEENRPSFLLNHTVKFYPRQQGPGVCRCRSTIDDDLAAEERLSAWLC